MITSKADWEKRAEALTIDLEHLQQSIDSIENKKEIVKLHKLKKQICNELMEALDAVEQFRK